MNKPHEQANKIIINDEEWWWYAGGTIIIWEPDHTRHLLNSATVSGTSFNIIKGSRKKVSKILEKDIQNYILEKLISYNK